MGRHITEALLEEGHQVRVFDLVEGFADPRVELLIGDIRNKQNVREAVFGATLVFHVAAMTACESYEDFFNVNVQGTLNVIEACRQCGVSSLVYTSTASVVIGPTQQIKNGSEEGLRYPKRHLDYYSATKALAEQHVLGADGTRYGDKLLSTCALRPHIIFGPRDVNFLAKIIDRGRRGEITHVIGEGTNVTDFTYIDNVVHAHLLAAERLGPGSACSGQAYFITNGEPRRFWDVVNRLLEDSGCAGPTKNVSFRTAYYFSYLMEKIRWFFGKWCLLKPTISRHTLCLFALNYWFNHSKATRDIGYKPIVTLEQGIQRCLRSLRQSHSNRPRRHSSSVIED